MIDLLTEADRARLRRSAPPPPVLEIEWGAGLDALVITVRQGRADPPYWESYIEWAVPSFEEGEQVGSHMRSQLLPDYAATIAEAAQRALAGLYSINRWSTDLSDYVLEKALQAAGDKP